MEKCTRWIERWILKPTQKNKHHDDHSLYLSFSDIFPTKVRLCFGGICGMATANPYRPVLLAASLDPTGSVRWADAQLWGGEQWWNQGHKLLLLHTMFSTCKASVSWLEELDGGSELSRPLVQDRLSAAEHCSDTGGVQEENGALGSHTGSLRWGGLGSTFASHQRQSMI